MEIVGLKNFVQDDVNKLIAKFVGFKPHPVAILLKPLIRKHGASETFAEDVFLWGFVAVPCYKCGTILNDDDDYVKELCLDCYEDEYFCPRCRKPLTDEEMELTDERPLLCNQCDEEENETEEEYEDYLNEQRVNLEGWGG